ncbi:DUF7005 family protein [Flavobacterium hydrophilum]|uniref:Uncharacterized protein n=1 Tax=Flavobacterium hydrophilum TaxID=2211445 RepID=A0A2V4C9Q1_9FLAO|nr:hypothetical protein [Flavobacterium hydrophilum]PXY46700.1 hypothetical protein DMB68_05925 [Flavobacterium hydrophilum]
MDNSVSLKVNQEFPFNLSHTLKEYLFNKFGKKQSFLEESNIEFWDDYSENNKNNNAFDLLKRCYPQLNFPIETGIEKTELYKDATLRGKKDFTNLSACLELTDPSSIKFEVNQCIAGKVPVLIVSNQDDFIKIIQSLLYKNNPVEIPVSMGAALINGINNWERINILKKDWLSKNPLGNWNQEFSTIIPNKSLYKDKLIILSTKPYSNVPAKQLGLTEDIWIKHSISIRKEHEFTHLYTLKRYGLASNNLHDELIADYIGIIKAIGYYDKNWMLNFMGLDEYPKYRRGGRLENYVQENRLTQQDFKQLIKIIKNAIDTIAIFDKKLGKLTSVKDERCRIEALCETGLTVLASQNDASILLDNYYEKFNTPL